MEIDFSKLKEPFEANDIEWRLQSCGEKNSKFWGKALAYVTNRAIQNRLDEVCGPENWKNEFVTGPNGGILCGISIKCNGEWVTKWDGAENTQIEAVKGGLSDSMKRSAVQWGLGRYLYNLDEGWAEINENGKYTGCTKDKKYFKWNPPKLPEWALPKIKKAVSTESNRPKQNSVDTEDSELNRLANTVEDFISKGLLSNGFAERAREHIANKNIKGLKDVIAYVNDQQKKGA